MVVQKKRRLLQHNKTQATSTTRTLSTSYQMHEKQLTQPTKIRYSLNKNSSVTTNSIKRTLRNIKSSEKPIPALVISKKTLEVSKRDNLSSYEDFIHRLKSVNSKQFPIPDAFNLISPHIKTRPKMNKDQPITKPSKTTSPVGKINKLVLADYEYINFPILSQSIGHLTEVAIEIISKFGLAESVSGRYVLKKTVKQIANGYNSLAYHNFSHAFSLMHMLYHLLKMDSAFRMLYSKQELTFVLIAALAHDLNHQGTNNAFEVKNNSQLAKIAENDAVLQKMHVRTFFAILKSKSITLLQKSKNPIQMKKLITRVILATDVSKHFAGVQKLKKLSQQQQGQFIPNDKQNRYFMMEQAFHACDIGNPCLEYKQYISWAALLSYQFNTQTILEQQNKVEVSAMLKYKGMKGFYQGQIGFINALVLPLWKQLTVFWPNFTSLVQRAESNLAILSSAVTQQPESVNEQK